MERPRVDVNEAAWRAAALTSAVITLALVGALIAQTTLGSGPDSEQKDPLATLALVLAVLAFLIQIFVYVLQSNESVRSAERGEELNSRTQHLLDEIRSTSQATQQVQVAQFDRLLDYVVGQPSADDGSPTEEVVDGEEALTEAASMQAAVEERVIRELSRQTRRPEFTSTPLISAEDQSILDFYTATPTEAEVEAATEKLLALPPLAVAKLRTFRDSEVEARSRGRRQGFTKSLVLGDWTPSTKRLMAEGLAEIVNDRVSLTPEGRQLARLTALTTGKSVPPYLGQAINRLSGFKD